MLQPFHCILYISQIVYSAILLFILFYSIVYFNISFSFISVSILIFYFVLFNVNFNILFYLFHCLLLIFHLYFHLYLLFPFMLYFVFLLLHWNKSNFPPGINKVFWIWMLLLGHWSKIVSRHSHLLSTLIRGPSPRGRGNVYAWFGPDSCQYLRHKKLHISTYGGRYKLGQHIFAYNSHTVCRTFKNLVSPDSLNGAESLCGGQAQFCLERFFAKSQKLENLLFRTAPWDFVRSAWN